MDKQFRRRFGKKPKFECKEAIGAPSRAAAAKIVNAVSSGISLSEAIPQYCAELDARDTGFVKEIVYGTLRHRRLLMNTLNPMFEVKITENNRVIQALLLTAFYQLVFMRAPVHAVVSASVSACGACGRKSFSSLVNAILRRFLREGAKLVHIDNQAVENSFPDWLFNRIIKAYGEEKGLEIIKKSNEKAPMFIRVESSVLSAQEYLEQMRIKGIEAQLVDNDLATTAIKLESPVNVDELPGFFDGLCSVQDLSAQMAAPLLEIHQNKGKNLRILDCCSAPGGKTAHILDLAPYAEVTALDVDEIRLKQTANTLKRLKLEAQLIPMDAQDLSKLDGLFDRILVDAPCSGTGVIRRHPDIKWLRREKDIATLVETQKNILDAAVEKLAVDGILVYTTCSIMIEENVEQVKAFLERHKNMIALPFKVNGKEYDYLQRLPNEDGGDGFFYARFVKKA